MGRGRTALTFGWEGGNKGMEAEVGVAGEACRALEVHNDDGGQTTVAFSHPSTAKQQQFSEKNSSMGLWEPKCRYIHDRQHCLSMLRRRSSH